MEVNFSLSFDRFAGRIPAFCGGDTASFAFVGPANLYNVHLSITDPITDLNYVNFFFWNLFQKQLQHNVATAINEWDVDFVLLAEVPFDCTEFIDNFDLAALGYNYSPSIDPNNRLHVIARMPLEHCPTTSDGARFSIRHVSTVDHDPFLLTIVHLPSKREFSDADQADFALDVVAQINQAESDHATTRTLVVGDFNLNPFELAMISSHHFHAVMCRETATTISRRIQGLRHHFFYNPTWSLMGRSPPGTHFYRKAVPNCFFWNTFDQVLIRPSLLCEFDDSSLSFVTKIGTQNLLQANGRPNKVQFSDHLPITFALNTK